MYCFKPVGETLEQLSSPNWGKALTVLDATLLPSTSHAVERGTRHPRKMQKPVYRVRPREHISRPIALAMRRQAQVAGRTQVTRLLHLARSGS